MPVPNPHPGRRTRIVATLGPASSREPMLTRVLGAGVDVVRLNFSHGTHDEHAETIRLVRAAERKLGWPIGILQDLGGPKIRIGPILGGEMPLRRGLTVRVDPDCDLGGGGRVGVTYSGLAAVLHPGHRLMLDDGKVEMRVSAIEGRELVCRVVRGRTLGERKGLNVPGVDLPIPAVTPKDLDDLAFGIKQGVDLIALSFVRTAEDVASVQRRVRRLGGDQPVIAKLERGSAIRNLDAILAQADGLMVARGDMAIELSPERVPVVQKEVIARATVAGKPVITATQMLESMVDSPRPTRAEASDVANAILDGTDAVMLSEETAAGRFPVEAVKVMNRIAHAIEHSRAGHNVSLPQLDEVGETPRAVARAARDLADSLHAQRLVIFTTTGSSARFVSKARPRTPILAVTPRVEVSRRMQLLFGVRSLIVPEAEDADKMFEEVGREALRTRHVKKGDLVVMVFGQPVGNPGNTNAIQVRRVG